MLNARLSNSPTGIACPAWFEPLSSLNVEKAIVEMTFHNAGLLGLPPQSRQGSSGPPPGLTCLPAAVAAGGCGRLSEAQTRRCASASPWRGREIEPMTLGNMREHRCGLRGGQAR